MTHLLRCRRLASARRPQSLLWILAVPTAFLPARPSCAAQPPAGDAPPALHAGPGGREALLPNGRRITPPGTEVTVPPHPYSLALSSDGRTLVATSDGTGPFALTVITTPAGPAPAVRTVTAADASAFKSAYLGLALAPDGRTLYASGGNDGRVHIFDLTGVNGPAWVAAIGLDGGRYTDSLPSRLALSPDGKTLLALDAANDRVAVIDTATRAIVASAPTGHIPFAVRWAPDGRTAYIANAGLFTYQPVEKATGKDPRGLPFAPFGYPSKAARNGDVVDGRRVPGLGPVRTPEAYSVWALDLSQRDAPRSLFRVNTGVPIAAGAATDGDRDDVPATVRGAVGGSLPCAVATMGTALYISNANDDTVEVRDGRTGRLTGTVNLSEVLPGRLRGLRGLTPYGLTLSPDGKRLYVALSGFDAVAVVATGSRRVLGLIPAGWYPADVAVSPDGRNLYIANAKGRGSGPNAGKNFHPAQGGSYVAQRMQGTLQTVTLPADAALPTLTRAVLANNGVPADGDVRPHRAAPLPPIKHILLIVKENRTFDEVFGALPGVRGDASLARYGSPRTVPGIGTDRPVVAMPNHLALARRFAISDNFCVDSDVSSDGHRWLAAAPPNHWSDSVISAAYGGQMDGNPDSPAPGRRILFGSNSSAMPEDYPEAGTIWHHLARGGIPFRNWGEGFEFAGIDEGAGLKPTGGRLPLNIPMPQPLFANTSRAYPGFNTNIPDQYRADVFLREFAVRYESGRERLPRFLYMHLPNDHGAGPRPRDGYPAVASYMADNDLALGRIVERLSHSRFWKEMAILVTEDDAQGGVDSVDAHRSVLMVLSPWVKPAYVSHQSADISAIHNAVFRLLDLPPLSLYDALASDLSDVWAKSPNQAPYTAVSPDPLLFDPRKAKDPNDPDYRQARLHPSAPMDDPEEVQRYRGERSGSPFLPF